MLNGRIQMGLRHGTALIAADETIVRISSNLRDGNYWYEQDRSLVTKRNLPRIPRLLRNIFVGDLVRLVRLVRTFLHQEGNTAT